MKPFAMTYPQQHENPLCDDAARIMGKQEV